MSNTAYPESSQIFEKKLLTHYLILLLLQWKKNLMVFSDLNSSEKAELLEFSCVIHTKKLRKNNFITVYYYLEEEMKLSKYDNELGHMWQFYDPKITILNVKLVQWSV